MEVIRGSLYDYPLYYDLVYGSDWYAELKFLEACFPRFIRGQTKTIFEPACGTGRLLHRLACRKFKVSGLDLNAKAVEFCNARLKRLGFRPTAFVGDMADFVLQQPVDAAFNTINSFRHLPTEQAARSHLQCMAQAVRPGGIYVLGLHLTPTTRQPITEESWHARRGHLVVNTSMWTMERDLARREERCGIAVDVYKPTENFRIEDELVFRTYTWPQLQETLAAAPQWQLTAAYDFAYDFRTSVTIGSDTEDVVLILKRT